ncbi:MAG: hypothetical protein AAGB51_03430 [Planctomycetota bacterium]
MRLTPIALVVCLALGGCRTDGSAPHETTEDLLAAVPLSTLVLPPLPEPVSNNAVASVANTDGSFTLYSLMGINDPADTDTITTRSYALDVSAEGRPLSRGWRRIADAPAYFEKGKIGASAVGVAGALYLIGGYAVVETDAGDTVEVTEPRLLRYDVALDRWVELAEVPTPVDDTAVAVMGGRYIYLFSGWHGPINDNVRNTQVYDALEDRWLRATPLPAPGVFGHAAAISGDTVIVCDGTELIRGSDGSREFRISDRAFVGTISRDDPTEIAWRRISPHPGEPTYRAGMTTTPDGLIHLVGGTANPYNIDGVGYNGVPSSPLAQHLIYDPDPETGTGAWQLRLAPDARMDLRGVIHLDGSLIQIGGMTGPGVATSSVR